MEINKTMVSRRLGDDLKGILKRRGILSQMLIQEGHLSNGQIFAFEDHRTQEGNEQNQYAIGCEMGRERPKDGISRFILDFLRYKPMNLCIFDGLRFKRNWSSKQGDKRIYQLKNEVCYFLSGQVSEELLHATIQEAEFEGRFVCLLSEGIRDVYDRQSRIIKEQQMRSLVRRAQYIIVGIYGSTSGLLWCYEEPQLSGGFTKAVAESRGGDYDSSCRLKNIAPINSPVNTLHNLRPNY